MNCMRFSCLALIEYETSLLYDTIIEKVKDEKVKLLLLNILEETKKHEKILKAISKLYGHECSPLLSECEKILGKMFNECIEFTRAMRRSIQEGSSVKEVLNKLICYEENIGEEYLSQIQSRITEYMTGDPVIKEIMEYIVNDEVRHVNSLKLALTLL